MVVALSFGELARPRPTSSGNLCLVFHVPAATMCSSDSLPCTVSYIIMKMKLVKCGTTIDVV